MAAKKTETRIFFLPENKAVEVTRGATVLDVALANKIRIPTSCGGMGTCGTCRVFVEGDVMSLPPRNEIEHEFAEDRKFKANERLACQIEAIPGLRVRIP